MATKNTKLKDFQISKAESKNLKGGYAEKGTGIGGGGTGSTGFIIWDNIDPRDNGLLVAGTSVSSMQLNLRKK